MKPDNKLSVVKAFERAAKETTWEPETLRKIITHPGDRKGDGDRRWPRVMPSDCPPCQRSCRIGEQMNKQAIRTLSACLFVLFLAAGGKTLRKGLILFFLFVSPTFAQIKTITGGSYQNTNGSPCAGCVLYLQLGTDATVIGTGQIIPSTNSYTLDANGNVPANSPLWANDQMQPSGLTYKATLTLPGGGRIWGPEFLFISGPSPISLTQIVPVASSSVFFVAPALLGVSNTFTGSNTFSQQIISTVTTGTAPFSIASTTVVPNLDAQLHNGLTAPASAIVGISDTQTLTNKTLTSPAISTPTLDGVQAGHVVSQTSAATNFGTGLSAQTITSNVPFTGPVWMLLSVLQSTVGVGCSASTNTVSVNLVSYTAPGGSALTFNPNSNLSITGNGSVDSGDNGSGVANFNNTTSIVIKTGSALTYTATSTLGSTGCTTTPQYTIFAKAFF